MLPAINDVASNVWRPYRVLFIEIRGSALDVVPTHLVLATTEVAARDVSLVLDERSQSLRTPRAGFHHGQLLDTF